MMTVSERLRSCWGPTRPAHHGDLRSSQWNMPQWLHQLPVEWKKRTCSDILSDALSGRPHQSLQPALSFREIFMHEDFSEFEFSCRSSIKHSPWAVCFVIVMWKKVACFYEPQFGRISLNNSPPHSVLETNKLQRKVYDSTCQTI